MVLWDGLLEDGTGREVTYVAACFIAAPASSSG